MKSMKLLIANVIVFIAILYCTDSNNTYPFEPCSIKLKWNNSLGRKLIASNTKSEIMIQKYADEVAIALKNSLVTLKNITYRVLYDDSSMILGLCALDYIASPPFEKDQYFNSITEFNRLNLTYIYQIPKLLSTSSLAVNNNKELLIVLTTCNQLNMTVLVLDYLKDTLLDADLIIVDDYSVDGTPEYLIKKGYTVITKDHAKGLTDSWNKGYEFANVMKYKYVVFTNNDVLLTSTTVKVMKEDLRNEALVGPLTTLIGAGHNPSQVFIIKLFYF
jgi:hypothetical protein